MNEMNDMILKELHEMAFEYEAEIIMAIAKADNKSKSQVIKLTKEMYELKNEYFKYFSLEDIRKYIDSNCCPLCSKYFYSSCSRHSSLVSASMCPLFDLNDPCCYEFKKMNDARMERNRRKFRYWFKKLKKRIDSL